jgi:diguanylate cyclase
MFGKKTSEPREPVTPPSADDPAGTDTALDTLAGVLRNIAEFALEQENTDIETFRQRAEEWAQHVALAAPAPGTPREEASGRGGRRDWQGVRQFVREYCRSSSKHVSGVTADLRDVIWVFIRNFSQALSLDEEVDGRIQQQVARLEALVGGGAASELKREVEETVGRITQAFEERRHRQRIQMASLGETVRVLGYELESVRRENETDPLTGIFNRKAFDDYLQRTVEMFQAFRHDMGLIVVDVDNFKEINDSAGHTVGDQALREIANTLARVFLRKSDFVARFGGDEFAVVLRETALSDTVALAERVMARLKAVAVSAGDRSITLSVSMGVAAIERGEDAKVWFERADRNLYQAKSQGRGRMIVSGAV